MCREKFANLSQIWKEQVSAVGGKGSHRKFVHPKFGGFVLISGHDGDDAQHYQEKQLRKALKQVQS